MQSLDVRLKALEAATQPPVQASADCIFAWCQSRGIDVPPVGNLTVTEWLQTVPMAALRNILNGAGGNDAT